MDWDRRRFLLAAGAVAGLSALELPVCAKTRRSAYVTGTDDRLHVFSAEQGEWRPVQTVACVAPAGVAVSPDGRFVYVGNAVERFAGRPSGSVEAFAVDRRGGLTVAGRQGLALFATSPERLAVSPNGRWLGFGLAGGAYNLLALGADGLPGRVTASLRRIAGKSAAGTLAFGDDRSLLSFDGEEWTALSVGEDGSLAFADSMVGGSVVASVRRRSGEDEGLLEAMMRAGIEARGLAVSRQGLG